MKITESAKKLITNKMSNIKDPVFVIAEVEVQSCCSTRKELRPFLIEKNELPPPFTYTSYDLKNLDPELNLPLFIQKGKEECWDKGEITTRTLFGNTRSLYFEYPRDVVTTSCCK